MNKQDYKLLEASLVGTRRNIKDVCKELEIPLDDIDFHNLDVTQCTHCYTWVRTANVIEDLDDNPICKYCAEYIGL